MQDILQEFHPLLAQFSQMSGRVGGRSDYVQGGGGNTSVKLPGGLMAIKASGFHLGEVLANSGFAVLDSAQLRAFYQKGDPEGFGDVEQAGSLKAREATLEVPGLAALRPSVEAGFHALLDTFVIHSHSVWANLAACAAGATEQVEQALSGAPYAFAVIPYVNPGARLTFTMRDAIQAVEKREGRRPGILVMLNHGLVAHAPGMAEALDLHEDANARFRKHFGLLQEAWPQPAVRAKGEGFVSDTPWLKQRLKGDAHPDSALLQEPLYPDQMVFFQDTLGKAARIDRQSGETTYSLPQKNAQTLEETLCAVVFIRETLKARGLMPQSMGEAAQAFISGWESEKYRKSLAGRKP